MKKALSLALCAALAVSVLAGCGSKNGSSASSGGSSAAGPALVHSLLRPEKAPGLFSF